MDHAPSNRAGSAPANLMGSLHRGDAGFPQAALAWRIAIALVVAIALAASLISAAAGQRSGGTGTGVTPAGASGPVAGETYLWKPVAIGGGGFITGLSWDRTGRTRVARADVYGAYRWDAGADRWVQLVTAPAMPPAWRAQDGVNEGVYEIAVAPSSPDRIYMATKGRLFRSDDGGRSFVDPARAAPFPLTFDPNSPFRLYGPFLAIDPADPDIVFFGTPQDGLWRSFDGGVRWDRIASIPASADLRPEPGVQAPGVLVWFVPGARPGAPRILAASAGHGVYAATDPRGEFRPVAAPGSPQPATVRQGSFGSDGTFYAIDQEGRSAWTWRGGAWRRLGGGQLKPAAYAGIAADPAGARVIVTDEGGQAWCSADGGEHWQSMWRTAAVGAGEPPWLRINSGGYFASGQIAFDPAERGRLWVAAGTGPYVAAPGDGCSLLAWKSQVRGIEELVANEAVHPPGHAPLFAGWDFGIHRKPDLDAFSTGIGPKERFIAVQQIDWSGGNPGLLVTNASDTRMDCCSEDGDSVLAGTSRDGGVTWQKFPTLPQPPGTRADDPWRMSFGSIAVAADDGDNIVWAPAFNRSPFYTVDGGKSWHRVVLPGEVLPDTGSFVQFYVQRKTMTADKVRPGTFYYVHSGDGANRALAGLWRTEDRGAHWTHVHPGEIAPMSAYAAKLRAVPGKAGHLFFTSGVSGDIDTRLRRSADGGRTWRALDGIDRVDDVAFGKAARGAPYPAIYISGRVRGRYGVWRSVDDAGNWQQLVQFPLGRLDQVTVIEADKDMFGRVYLGYKGSGWIHGEPAPCRAAPFAPGGDADCSRVDGDGG